MKLNGAHAPGNFSKILNNYYQHPDYTFVICGASIQEPG